MTIEEKHTYAINLKRYLDKGNLGLKKKDRRLEYHELHGVATELERVNTEIKMIEECDSERITTFRSKL